MDDTHKLPDGFISPTATPVDSTAHAIWQQHNKEWWQSNPMRYDWNSSISKEEFTAGFFEEIDRRHFMDSAFYSPYKTVPFEEILPYSELANQDVLEVG